MNKDGSEKTEESREFIPQSGEQKAKDSPKDLKEIVAEFAQKNRTLFCICLAFSIWFYHGMFDWSTNFGTRVKSSSETLFVVQVFLTAFAVSRFLVFINIIDIILRMPVVCDLIFWLSWRDNARIKTMLKFKNEECISSDEYKLLTNIIMQQHRNSIITDLEVKGIIRQILQTSKDYQKIVPANLILKEILNVIFNQNNHIRYSILRYATIQTKGFFYEEKWLPKIPKLDKCIKNKKYREAIGFTLALAIYALSIALIYWVYKYFNPAPMPITTPEQLFFSYVNKHFL
jgi:hypothetical protein